MARSSDDILDMGDVDMDDVARKMEDDEDLDSSNPAAIKRRKAKAGGRGVANLTPEQLAKKRANDREAQRNIRERTKKQIETLERRIEELTNQRPYQELQTVIRAKEAVEQENAEIKQKLAGIINLLHPIIQQDISSSSNIIPPALDLSTATTTQISQSSTVTPTTATASSPIGQQQLPVPPQPAISQTWSSSQQNSPAYISPAASGDYGQFDFSQQRDRLRHGLEMGHERLDLDFLLDSRHQVTRLQSNHHGAQDTGGYRYTQVANDFTPYSQKSGSRPPTLPPLKSGPNHSYYSFSSGYACSDPNISPNGPTGEDSTELVDTGDPAIGLIPKFSAPCRTCAPTCPLDSLLLEFLHERHQRAAEGHPVHEVAGPRYPSVSSLLNPTHGAFTHPLSRVFTDILAKFPELSGLPERVSVLYIMFLVMRWQVSPTRENYERLPVWIRPLPCQITTPHPAWLDYVPFPRMRERLVRLYNPTEFHFDIFFLPYATTLHLSWPYEEADTLLRSPNSDELMINPVFERHLRNHSNWKLGDAFGRTFPALADTANIPSLSMRSSVSAPSATTG